jgi:hypothetical protein
MLEQYYSEIRLLLGSIDVRPTVRDGCILVAGLLLGYGVRSLISARRRARARNARRYFVE